MYQITDILKMICPAWKHYEFSTKNKATLFQQLQLIIHGERQMEGEKESGQQRDVSLKQNEKKK